MADESDFEEAKNRIVKAYENAKFNVRIASESSEFSIWQCHPKSGATVTQ
jgi:hypothetical protein